MTDKLEEEMAVLVEGMASLGLTLSRDQLALFRTYQRELIEWNQRISLTAIREPEGIQRLHFVDSLTLAPILQRDGLLAGEDASLVDVGSGAGLPGLALRILFPQVRLALIESVGKKARFLDHLVAQLDLDGVTVLPARAEAVGHDDSYRESFQVAVTRGTGGLATVAELTLPLCRVGGRVYIYKKGDLTAELAAAEPAIDSLGGRLLGLEPVAAPGLEDERCLVCLAKERATPERYPRRNGVPRKRPLGLK